MLDNFPDVQLAHESDDLLFGTIESWIAYVWCLPFSLKSSRSHPP